MNLSLTSEELTLLRRILTNYLPDLREEISKTENFNWRTSLKKDEVVLKAIIARLEAGVRSSAIL